MGLKFYNSKDSWLIMFLKVNWNVVQIMFGPSKNPSH